MEVSEEWTYKSMETTWGNCWKMWILRPFRELNVRYTEKTEKLFLERHICYQHVGISLSIRLRMNYKLALEKG